MNTHLHVMEAYATLLAATGDAQVKERLGAVLDIFLTRIVHPRDFHLRMFFDERWVCRSERRRSFGHDIEASWLLSEAAHACVEQRCELIGRNLEILRRNSIKNRDQ